MSELEFVQQLRFYAASHNYKNAWVYTNFRAKYGKWPNKLFKEGEPMEPSPETLQFIRAEQERNYALKLAEKEAKAAAKLVTKKPAAVPKKSGGQLSLLV